MPGLCPARNGHLEIVDSSRWLSAALPLHRYSVSGHVPAVIAWKSQKRLLSLPPCPSLDLECCSCPVSLGFSPGSQQARGWPVGCCPKGEPEENPSVPQEKQHEKVATDHWQNCCHPKINPRNLGTQNTSMRSPVSYPQGMLGWVALTSFCIHPHYTGNFFSRREHVFSVKQPWCLTWQPRRPLIKGTWDLWPGLCIHSYPHPFTQCTKIHSLLTSSSLPRPQLLPLPPAPSLRVAYEDGA